MFSTLFRIFLFFLLLDLAQAQIGLGLNTGVGLDGQHPGYGGPIGSGGITSNINSQAAGQSDTAGGILSRTLRI
ncbi:unnamed protein product [Caenorhabditis auriculariae]|uniref:Uncharacterized protein n=1 Tax=Caenorhabditis auriculariae TaxID=2777116 RepID=A0A8S1H4L3_9PELO|nr:unnamed protein product [Caenorhabditis auriculariae]